ncbi:hypothetical protein DSO57_1006951 [Entomophthora muscae]|uniref:Uncharacterized protein n=1 Tax=Entomophthora muscae TaxID=34485 RepID=A0ACC2TIG5_9FUNG|nr:hypothetical protein DSO57_1006951 [Entomophthora muscae]
MSGGALLQSLMPNKEDYSLTQDLASHSPVVDHPPSPLAVIITPQMEDPSPLQVVPSVSCTPWLLTGALVMAANAYFSAVTPTLSLQTSVIEALPFYTGWHLGGCFPQDGSQN